ncbi:MAG: hypothetical protein ACRC3B_12990 [Bacteroidia bacterium]
MAAYVRSCERIEIDWRRQIARRQACEGIVRHDSLIIAELKNQIKNNEADASRWKQIAKENQVSEEEKRKKAAQRPLWGLTGFVLGALSVIIYSATN